MAKVKRKPQGGDDYSLADAIKETMSLYKAFTAPIDLNEVDIHSHIRYRKSNCLALDWVIANHSSNGGWPMGKMIEIYGPEGCLAAETFIQYNIVESETGRVQNHKGGSIQDLYNRFHRIPRKGQGKYQRKQSVDCDFWINSINENDCIFRQRILNVVHTGNKMCYTVKTKLGNTISCTSDHKFYTGSEYLQLNELKVGDTVYVHNNTAAKEEKKERECYRSTTAKWYYKGDAKEINGCWYYKLAEHRLIYEAHINGITYEAYKDILNKDQCLPANFLTIPDGYEVHHIDENKKNNHTNNLEMLDYKTHGRLHLQDNKDRLSFIAMPDEIVEIKKWMVRSTYDIKCEFPHNNYIAEGFVVHNCGKTTIATVIAIAVQKYKDKNKVLIVDFEHKYNLPYAFSLGLDPRKTIFIQPSGESSGEQGMNLIINAAKANDVGLIICDSINALITKQEEEGDLGDANIGSKARLQTQTIRKIANKQHPNSPTIIWINQLVDNIGVMFGSTEKTPGARAIRFFSAVRIDLRARAKIEVGDDTIGQYIEIKAKKNQCGRPFIEEEIKLIFGEGYDNISWVIEKAEKLEVIEKKGKKYYGEGIEWLKVLDLQGGLTEVQLIKELENKINLYGLYDLCVKKNEERLKLAKGLEDQVLEEEPEESSEQNSEEELSPF